MFTFCSIKRSTYPPSTKHPTTLGDERQGKCSLRDHVEWRETNERGETHIMGRREQKNAERGFYGLFVLTSRGNGRRLSSSGRNGRVHVHPALNTIQPKLEANHV